MPDVLGEIVPDVGPKCEKVRNPWVLRLKRWSLSMCVSDEERIRGNRQWLGNWVDGSEEGGGVKKAFH